MMQRLRLQTATEKLELMQHYVIIGASRGIGLALAAELLKSSSRNTVYGLSRNESEGLAALRAKYETRLKVLPTDATQESSLLSSTQQILQCTTELSGVFYVAGFLHNEIWKPEKRIDDINVERSVYSFTVNTIGPMLAAKHFWRLLSHDRRSVFITVSARVGSIEDNRLGGWYSYRASKASQNMFVKTLSIEMDRRAPNVICSAFHPGTVDTDLSKPFQRNVPSHKLFSPSRAAKQLIQVTDALTKEDSGGFKDWAGKTIPW